jgi:hypothetical protein
MADLTGYRFPNNTAVIAITTHGAIPTDDAGSIVTFEVPEGMTITKMSIAPVGVCNMAAPDDSIAMARAASDVFNDPNPKYTLQQRIDTIVPILTALQKGVVANVAKRQTRGVPKNQPEYEFLVYADRSSAVNTYNPGQELINKIYVKNPGEGAGHPYDFKMPILNKPNNPNFLQLLTQGRLGPETRSMGMNNEQYTTLSYIAGALRYQCQVERLVLLDYSCSSFYDNELTKRAQRALATWARNNGVGGKRKRTRRRKNKTKTRKANKKRVSWNP